jgi:hypothetical protein
LHRRPFHSLKKDGQCLVASFLARSKSQADGVFGHAGLREPFAREGDAASMEEGEPTLTATEAPPGRHAMVLVGRQEAREGKRWFLLQN